jgi:hypothetical protein
MSGDWVIAFDDHVVVRLERCTACGSRLGVHAYGVCQVEPRLALAYAWCQPCLRAHPDRQALDAVLEARYRPEEET